MSLKVYFNSAVKSVTFLDQTVTVSGGTIDTSSVSSGGTYSGTIEFIPGLVSNCNSSYTPTSNSSKDGSYAGGGIGVITLRAGTSGINGTLSINATVIEIADIYEKTVTNTEFTVKCAGKKMTKDLKIKVDVEVLNPQEKTVTPTKTIQELTPDSDYNGLSKVTINAIPDNYIEPSGTLEVTENGSFDITEKASVNVNVPTGVDEETLYTSLNEMTFGNTKFTITVKGVTGHYACSYMKYYLNGDSTTPYTVSTDTVTHNDVESITFYGTISGNTWSSAYAAYITINGEDVGTETDITASYSETFTITEDSDIIVTTSSLD